MADPMTPDRWFLSDCEGRLEIWREAVLRHVTRDEHGEIDGYALPAAYKDADLIASWDLSTWDEGEDPDDDARRRMYAEIVRAHNDGAEVERLRADLAAFQPEPMSQLCRDGEHNGVGDWKCLGCHCLCHNRDTEVEQLQRNRDGWENDARTYSANADHWRAEVERLRAELDEATGTAYQCANCGLWHHDDEPADPDVRCDECGHSQPRDEAEFLPAYTAVKAQRDAFRMEAVDAAAKRDAAEARIEELEDGWDRDAKRLRAELAEERARHGELVAEMQRTRQAADAEQVRADGWRDKADSLTEQRDDAARSRDEAREQVKRVREQHPPESRGGRTVCGACLGSDEEPLPWPCPTMAALDGTGAGR